MDRNCGANVKHAIHPSINREGDRTVALMLNMPYILLSIGMGSEDKIWAFTFKIITNKQQLAPVLKPSIPWTPFKQ